MTSKTTPHMSSEEFRRWGHATVDWVAQYLERLEGAYGQWMAEARDRFEVIEVDTTRPGFLESGLVELRDTVQEAARRKGRAADDAEAAT